MANLSKDWTARRFYNMAGADLESDVNQTAFIQRFDLINKTIELVTTLFYDLMISAYMTPVTLVPDTIGRYSSSGTGSWTAATSLLSFAGMNTAFNSVDVGKVIGFRIGASLYLGTISTFVSTSSITVTGLSLPSVDGTVAEVMVFSSVPGSNTVSLDGLRIMRTGQQVKMELESTATKTIEAVESQAVFAFDATSLTNKNKIVWCMSGDQIIFAKGSGLTNAGTFTLRYPRVPNILTSDTDFLDLPDGAAIEIALLHLKSVLSRRMKQPDQAKDFSAELGGVIRALYSTFGQEVQKDVMKEKVLALV